MSFFSRVHPHPRMLSNQEMLKSAMAGDVYLDHALVWRLFPGDDMDRDFVFRTERDHTGWPIYYVVSQRQPQAVGGLFSVDTKTYAPRLQTGEIVHFDLRANPTIAVGEGKGKKSRRHDVLMHAKYEAKLAGNCNMAAVMDRAALEWLGKRVSDWGLEVAPQSVGADGYMQHRLRHKGRSIEFSSVDYQGIAKVVDPVKLSKALLHGVGRAKGFGCGLLLIKRLD